MRPVRYPENGYKFRNGNDLFLLSACNTQRFSHANQYCVGVTILCPHRVIVTTIVTRQNERGPPDKGII